ncbi:hypothetical protein EGR_09070 [Echinococcus granulosus]|uniref:Uncharacterized protein n=1 Tax=Echinococcus granulosus TaxID=6210 RepID=W6U4M4_ECHGR|nr:hypothetical protein EGR_09070 [Echinococcus granulosus]EUB56080.1 hypothetical protein EGR_09070 [Echinococcus granulosus]
MTVSNVSVFGCRSSEMSSEKRNFGKAMNQDHEIDAQDSREEPVENGLPIDTKSHQNPLHAPMTISPSPPKQVTIDQLAEAANSFYKMSLVHEISVDSNFKVERKEEPRFDMASEVTTCDFG